MATSFNYRLLSHLSKKRKEGGFTLIELLVVVIIIGVLAAVALPSLLDQVGKARMSEGKSTLGAINRAQQAYRIERETFGSITDIDVTIPKLDEPNFVYTATVADADEVNNLADAKAEGTVTIGTTVTFEGQAFYMDNYITGEPAKAAGNWVEESTKKGT
ncbi:prepilin-type N-terminal cleavage/methylation domain-containing protein [Synechocystis sp. B12]|nr:prepilin-type N-terminal cleavage/methylation domain-containing protein [Synechocystis sp. B12]